MITILAGKKVKAHSYGLNKMRTSDFINIKHKIASCTKSRHIESLKQLVERFAKQSFEGSELLNIFRQKEQELNINF